MNVLCRYHADNESADLDSFHNATKIISKVRLKCAVQYVSSMYVW